VALLHDTLRKLLEVRLGRTVEIWRDDTLRGNDAFAQEIAVQVPQAGLFISVISPRYLQSAWCKREAETFCRTAAETAGMTPGRKSRVIKVIKLPVELTGLPEAFDAALGFPFYRPRNGVPLEIDPAYGPEMIGDFNVSVAMLAQALADTLETLGEVQPATTAEVSTKGIIYLAETGWDRDQERKHLETELVSRGYSVLPKAALPSREQECSTEVSRLLAQCKLSIHLVGAEPGMIPSGPSQKCVIALQNELAILQSRERGLRRIIWISDGAQAVNPSHRKFVDSLHRTDEAQFGADLITADFESLRSAALAALRKLETPEAVKPVETAQPAEKLVYVICDKRDIAASLPLRRFLNERGFEAKRPLFDGDAEKVRTTNERLLGECHAAIVFYGAGDECWFSSVDSEVRKLKSRAPVRTYIAEPATDHKSELELEGRPVLNGLAGLPEAQLEQFLSGLRHAAAAGGAA
jgi:hypothetical protein